MSFSVEVRRERWISKIGVKKKLRNKMSSWNRTMVSSEREFGDVHMGTFYRIESKMEISSVKV